MNICCYCNRSFVRRDSVTRHEKLCNRKEATELRQQLAEKEGINTNLHQQLAEKEGINTNLHQQLAEKNAELDNLRALTVQLEARVHELEVEAKYREELFQVQKQLAYKEGKETHLTHIETQAGILQAHILKENSKPRTTVNNIINLAPYPSSPDIVKSCEGYTSEHFLAGPESTRNFVKDKLLTNDKGEHYVVCTDVARGIFKGKTEDGTEIVDVGGKRLQKDFINPLKKTIRNTSKNLEIEADWDEEELEAKTVSHMRALAPKTLTKRLAGELRPKRAPSGQICG